MSSNVESMFYTREKPWHGLGVRVEEAPTSADALRLAGLDWEVAQEPIFTEGGDAIAGYRVNVRDSDRKVLGVVSDRYKIIQNREAFSFTDTLIGSGVRYETAGSLQEGKRVWLLARLPREYIRGAHFALSGIQQLPRRERRRSGGADPDPGSLQQHAEPCAGHGTAVMVHDPHGQHQ